MSKVKLGQKSLDRLATIHPRLREVVIKACESMPFDITVVEGVRTIERQKELLAGGTTWTMNSKHIAGADGFSHAVDIAPFPIDWNNQKAFIEMAHVMFDAADAVGVRIKWGGSWATNPNGWAQNKRFDGPHFELV